MKWLLPAKEKIALDDGTLAVDPSIFHPAVFLLLYEDYYPGKKS